jgi:hypothetical protein
MSDPILDEIARVRQELVKKHGGIDVITTPPGRNQVGSASRAGPKVPQLKGQLGFGSARRTYLAPTPAPTD